jgi:phosphoglycerate dehydrogenase-like enzyme
MKAVLHYRASPGFRRDIEAAETDQLKIVIVEESDRDRFGREMLDAEVLLHVLEPMTAAMIAAAPRLRLIQKLGIGVDTIDLEAARGRGIAVCNMPGTNTRAVAELTLLLMLATLRRLCVLDAQTRAGKGWTLDFDLLDTLGEIGGRTVGLVGFGAVGRCLAPMLKGIGAEIIYADVSATADTRFRMVSLDELLSTADIVSLHLPLTQQTSRMFDARTFASMKRGAVFVNAARGGLVDHAALHQSLVTGGLLGAGLDVLDTEPAERTHPLFALPNVVVTPHLGWFTGETLRRSLVVFVENCRRLRGGETLLNRVV